METTPTSPLAEASPESLSQLFNSDPEIIAADPAKQDRIIDWLIGERQRFVAEDALKSSRPKGERRAASAKTAATATLSLDDLGI